MNAAEGAFQVRRQKGLDASYSTRLARAACYYLSTTISIVAGGAVANAKDIMEVLALATNQGTIITVRALGLDANDAVETLGAIIKAEQ